MKLPIPHLNDVTLNWTMFLLAGALAGYELRKAVFATDPVHPLVALDWGLTIGAATFYLGRSTG